MAFDPIKWQQWREVLRKQQENDPDRIRERARSLYPYASDEAFDEFTKLYEWERATQPDRLPYTTKEEDADWENMAGLAWKGKHSKRDPAKALQHFTKAAEWEFPDAMYNLARAWETGTFGGVDTDKAATWYRRVVKQARDRAGYHVVSRPELELYAREPIEAFIRASKLAPANTDRDFDEFMELYRLYGIFPFDDLVFQGPAGDKAEKEEWRMRWWALAGRAHVGTSSKCSPAKGLEYMLAAAERDDTDSIYNLGSRWINGSFGRIDAERAAVWFKRAYDLGSGDAGGQLFHIMEADRRFTDVRFREVAQEILRKSAFELNSPAAQLLWARMQANKDKPGADFSVLKPTYEALAPEAAPLTDPASISAAMSLALRYYLGIGVGRDLRKAAGYAKQIIDSSPDEDIAVGKSEAQRLIYLAGETKNYKRMWAHAKEAAGFEGPWAIIQKLYDGSLSEAGTAQRLINGNLKSTETLCDCLWAAVLLAEYEGRPPEPLRSLKRLAENRLLGVTADDVITSSEDFGPLFNKRNQYGFPIPGAPLDEPELKHGMGEVVGLVASKGEIEFQFLQPSKVIGPLITPEDINVALFLTFGEQQPIWPDFSLEALEKQTPDRRRYEAEEKVWRPSWLGNTLFGKTMYAADYWMGRIIWSSRMFDDPGLSVEARVLLERFALAGGIDVGLSRRILLLPKQLHRTWTKNDDGWLCQFHKADMRVDGAYIVLHPDGTEDRNVNKNNTRLNAGRTAWIFTTEFDKICRLWPLFERTRQLMALLYALNGLRQKGFAPSEALKERITTIGASQAVRVEPRRSQRLIWKLEA